MFKKFITLASLGFFSLIANATIIDLGNITRDTNTRLDWLDVTETLNMSYDDVIVQMGIGNKYERWRYATAAELDQLIINFGYSAASTGCQYGVIHCDLNISDEPQIIEKIILTLGDTGMTFAQNLY